MPRGVGDVREGGRVVSGGGGPGGSGCSAVGRWLWTLGPSLQPPPPRGLLAQLTEVAKGSGEETVQGLKLPDI